MPICPLADRSLFVSYCQPLTSPLMESKKRQRGAEAPLDFREEGLSSPFFLAGQRFRGPDLQPLAGTPRFYFRCNALASVSFTAMSSGVAMLMLIGVDERREALFTGMESRSVDTV